MGAALNRRSRADRRRATLSATGGNTGRHPVLTRRCGRHILLVAREIAIVFAAGLTYVVVREVTEGNAQEALANAHRLSQVETTLGIAREHAAQSLIIGHGAARTVANWIYIWGHWPVIAVVAIGLFAARRRHYIVLRNSVILSGLIAFVFFALMPMAPPRLSGLGFVDTVTTWSSSYRVLQPPRYTNRFAAMPSLHFGWDMLVGIALFSATRSRLLRAFAIGMPMLMAFAVVATANHWILDIVVGTVIVLVGLALARRLTP